MQMQCSSRVLAATVPDWVIPRPDPGDVTMFQNTSRNCLPFLRAAGIKQDSDQHQALKTTIWALHRQYLHLFKYVEEQAPDAVDRLIAKAKLSLPWLNKYEDAWPARIYLKRYVDSRRPHLMRTRYAHRKQMMVQKSQALNKAPIRNFVDPGEDPGDILRDHNLTVREFLGSSTPSLEHHLDAFIKLGVKDQKTLQCFLSWPQVIQAQFLDEGHGILQLTSLEKKGLLVGCSLLTQKALQESLVHIVKPGYFDQ